MYSKILATISNLSLIAAIVAPFFVSWWWSLGLVFLAVLTSLMRSQRWELLPVLFSALSAINNDGKIKKIPGDARQKKKPAKAKEKSGWLTPKAKAFFCACYQIPLQFFWWLIGLPRKFIALILRNILALAKWRPKTKIRIPKIEFSFRKPKAIIAAPQVEQQAVIDTSALEEQLREIGINVGEAGILAAISSALTDAESRGEQKGKEDQARLQEAKTTIALNAIREALGVDSSSSQDQVIATCVTAVRDLKAQVETIPGLQARIQELESELGKKREDVRRLVERARSLASQNAPLKRQAEEATTRADELESELQLAGSEKEIELNTLQREIDRLIALCNSAQTELLLISVLALSPRGMTEEQLRQAMKLIRRNSKICPDYGAQANSRTARREKRKKE